MDKTFMNIVSYLRLTGLSDAEIARQAGCHGSTVGRIAEGQMPRYTLGVALKDLCEKRRAHLASLLGRDPTEGCHE